MHAVSWAAVVGITTLSSCGVLESSCTEIGCGDGATLSLRTADGTWPDGSYTLTITRGGIAHACALTLPGDFPGRGSVAEVACDPPLDFPGATLRQDSSCQETRTTDSISQSCTPLPDQYTLSVGVPGTPAELGVAVSRDESVLLERSVALSYVELRPNGEGCGPVCRQASAELALP
jgi:hypothetical protein